ncbi:MAG: hypothetical protein R3E31_25700 [Chloroflexota bacterium]
MDNGCIEALAGGRRRALRRGPARIGATITRQKCRCPANFRAEWSFAAIGRWALQVYENGLAAAAGENCDVKIPLIVPGGVDKVGKSVSFRRCSG